MPESAFKHTSNFEQSLFNPSDVKQRSQVDHHNDFNSEEMQKQFEDLTQKLNQQEVELQEYRQLGSYLDQVKSILRDKEPSMPKIIDLALKQEKIKNEQKSLKVLEIIKNRDKTIMNLKAEMAQYSQSSDSLHKQIEEFEK